MQSVNKENSEITGSKSAGRQQIARLAALTLIFSYTELLLPRIVPFFRLGLGNAALLMGLASGLTFPAFMLLVVVKAVAANLMAGTLFSPFFLVSFAQSLVSALVMFVLYRAGRPGMSREVSGRRLLGLYGISISGASASALVQIALSSLYLGQGTWNLLGPMLLFNLMSGFLTAWLAEVFAGSDIGGGSFPLAHTSLLATPSSEGGHPPRNAPPRSTEEPVVSIRPSDYSTTGLPRLRNILRHALLLAAAASVFFIKNTAVLCGFLVLSFLAQKLAHRKILLLPHLSIWLFVMVTSVLLPNGRVLFTVAGFSFTEGALLTGLQKALRLSIVGALSQTAATIKLSSAPDSLLSLTLAYYSQMLDAFRNTQGSLIKKIRAAIK